MGNIRATPLTATDGGLLTNNVGAALHTTRHLGAHADQIATAARSAFVDSMSSSLWIAAGLAVSAAVVALTQLPRHTTHVAGDPSVVAHGQRSVVLSGPTRE